LLPAAPHLPLVLVDVLVSFELLVFVVLVAHASTTGASNVGEANASSFRAATAGDASTRPHDRWLVGQELRQLTNGLVLVKTVFVDI